MAVKKASEFIKQIFKLVESSKLPEARELVIGAKPHDLKDLEGDKFSLGRAILLVERPDITSIDQFQKEFTKAASDLLKMPDVESMMAFLVKLIAAEKGGKPPAAEKPVKAAGKPGRRKVRFRADALHGNDPEASQEPEKVDKEKAEETETEKVKKQLDTKHTVIQAELTKADREVKVDIEEPSFVLESPEISKILEEIASLKSWMAEKHDEKIQGSKTMLLAIATNIAANRKETLEVKEGIKAVLGLVLFIAKQVKAPMKKLSQIITIAKKDFPNLFKF